MYVLEIIHLISNAFGIYMYIFVKLLYVLIPNFV